MANSRAASHGRADIVVLTVIAEELKRAHAVFDIAVGRHIRIRGTRNWQGNLRSQVLDTDYSIVISVIGEAGNYDAASATTEAILNWEPRIIFLVGIAAGIRNRIRIGEVVLAERTVAYESAAIKAQQGRPGEVREPRPEMYRIPHRLKQDIAAYHASLDLGRLEKKFVASGGAYPTPRAPSKRKTYERHVANTVTVRDGTIASGEKLLRNPERLYSFRSSLHGRVEAAEMEAAGFADACWRLEVPWLVVRGISDFGDSFKSDEFHGFAATTAAVVLRDFIEFGLELAPPVVRVDTGSVKQLDLKAVIEPLAAAADAVFSNSSREGLTLYSAPAASELGTDALIPLRFGRPFHANVFRVVPLPYPPPTPVRDMYSRFALGSDKPVQYFGLSEEAVISEIVARPKGNKMFVSRPFAMIEFSVQLQHVLDLTSPWVCHELGIVSPVELVKMPDRMYTQGVARRARKSGFEALMVLQRHTPEPLLVILDQLRLDSEVRILGIRQLDVERKLAGAWPTNQDRPVTNL